MDNKQRKINKILVATDFSESSHYAILKAIDIADSNAAKLVLIHVVEKKFLDKTIELLMPREVLQSSQELALNLMKKQIKKLSRFKLPIDYEIVSKGKPALKILQYANKNKMDLLIMGAHGQYSWRDSFVGTTADYVVQHTKIPVLIIKNKPRRVDYKILVPIDFSTVSKKALNYATKIFPYSKISTIHVASSEYEKAIEYQEENISKVRKALVFYLENNMKKFLRPFSKKLDKKSNIAFGYPGPTILQAAHKQHRDLIVMGTQGHSREHYLFIGSVANWLLTETDTDILLVPP